MKGQLCRWEGGINLQEREAVFQYLTLPVLPPTPSFPEDLHHERCGVKVVRATSEWFRTNKTEQPGAPGLNWEVEHDLFSTRRFPRPFKAHWTPPTIYKPIYKPLKQHSAGYAAPAQAVRQSIFLFSVLLLIDWPTRAQFDSTLIPTYTALLFASIYIVMMHENHVDFAESSQTLYPYLHCNERFVDRQK